MQHYILVNKVRVQVEILRPEGKGLQVEALREYRGATDPKTKRSQVLICKGQTFTVPHDQVMKVTAKESRDVRRAKAHKARMKRLHATPRRSLDGSESHSESLTVSSGSQPAKCPVCASEHVTGSCTMTSADMTSK